VSAAARAGRDEPDLGTSFRELSQPLLGDDGVLVFSEDVLQTLFGPDHALRPAIRVSGRELERVAHALDPNPKLMQRLVARAHSKALDTLRQPNDLTLGQGRQRAGRGLGRSKKRPAEALEDRGVRRRVQLLQHLPANPLPLPFEFRQQGLPGRAVGLFQCPRLAPQVVEEDVEVPYRPQRPAEAPELPTGLGGSPAIEWRRATRRKARSRRVATRSWCRFSGSMPYRVLGS
jgi:hypothetical protein